MNTPEIRSAGTDAKAIWVFTPSRTSPQDLESILVQRHGLLQDAVDRVVESASSDNKHHLLFVGPRGSGKTHLVTLIVSRVNANTEVADRLRIAWLNEDETCTSVLELLLKIHAALEARYPSEFKAELLAPAYDMKPDAALDFVSSQLLANLGSRTLLVVTENLDALFDGMGDLGQKQLRAFIQENPKLCIVATAQRLVENLTDRASPFFGFFQTEHLKPLNVEQATELLQNIARLHDNQEVVEFLSTGRGRSRVHALHHLSGGNHRIYIVLSQFITRDSMDSLIGPFMKMVDELTPYYQERVRWLPPLQRKIVEYLCRCEGTVPVKDIARKLFASPQTISSQLQDLREKGYVEANQRGRESLYEVSEPLMRICVEVKENNSHEPLRLLVDFLRVWYDDKDLHHRLTITDSASMSRKYLESALSRNKAQGSLRVRLLLDELDLPEITAETREVLAKFAPPQLEPYLLAAQCANDGDNAGAVRCLGESIIEEDNPDRRSRLLYTRSVFFKQLGQREDAVRDYCAIIDLPGAAVEEVANSLYFRGVIFNQGDDAHRAIEDFTSLIKLPGAPLEQVAKAYFFRGKARGKLGETRLEIEDYTAFIDLPDSPLEQVAKAYFLRGRARGKLSETKLEVEDYTALIQFDGAPINLVAMALLSRAKIHGEVGEKEIAFKDCCALIDLPGAPMELVSVAHFVRGVHNQIAEKSLQAMEDYTKVIALSSASEECVSSARVYRGLIYCQNSDWPKAIDDFTAVIALTATPSEELAEAHYHRGVAYFHANQKPAAAKDFDSLTQMPDAPKDKVVDAYLALARVHFSEGRWDRGIESLESGLALAKTEALSHRGDMSDLIGIVFEAGLSVEGRNSIISRLLVTYHTHEALPSLGEAVVKHMGKVFRAGEPFPSSDNVEGWATAWEQAAIAVPDFRLSIRLLRTAINFIKAGGKDRGVLLDLASTERSIVEQALGLLPEPS